MPVIAIHAHGVDIRPNPLGVKETHAYKLMEFPSLREGIDFSIKGIEKAEGMQGVRGPMMEAMVIGSITVTTTILTLNGWRYTIHAWHN
jgi:hypothetical protein